MGWLRGLSNADSFEKAVGAIPAALEQAKMLGVAMPEVVRPGDNDRSRQVLGFENGVLDIRTGQLLEPAAAAKEFVTVTTNCRWNPEAQHETIDKVFPLPETLPEGSEARDQAEDIATAYGWIRGHFPNDSLLIEVGDTATGKTARRTLTREAGGAYVSTIRAEALRGNRQGGETINSEMTALASPFRLSYVTEMGGSKMDVQRLNSDCPCSSWKRF